MPIPLELAFHGIEGSESMRRRIEEQVAKLEPWEDAIIGCRTVVELAHRHGHKSIVEIHVEVSVEGGTLFAKRDTQLPEPANQMGFHAAVGEAFDAMLRQLKEYKSKRRREVKVHEGGGYGRIRRLDHLHEHGFIETPDGINLFFHRAVVADDEYERLTEGAEVVYRVAEAEGAYGPQAAMVKLRPTEAKAGG
jgi:ribosome-associated translation inhibitor RaiA/cold shock CspA family protein